jgi:hypothetical protein
MITFRSLNALLLLSLVIAPSTNIQAMRRVEPLLSSLPQLAKPFLALRGYSMRRDSQTLAAKIGALDFQIMRHEIDVAKIKRKQKQDMLQEFKEVAAGVTIFGTCYVPIYGLKSLLVSTAVTLGLIPMTIIVHQLTPHDKKVVKNHKQAIKELQEKKVSLLKERM